MTLSDGGVLIFFLILFAGRQAGRQAGSLSCLALSSCDCMCDEPSHREGGEAAEANVSFFFLGGRGADGRGEVRTGQDREENPSISSYIYTLYTRARASGTGRGE